MKSKRREKAGSSVSIEFEHGDAQDLTKNPHQLRLPGARRTMNQHVDPGFTFGPNRFQVRQQEVQAHLEARESSIKAEDAGQKPRSLLPDDFSDQTPGVRERSFGFHVGEEFENPLIRRIESERGRKTGEVGSRQNGQRRRTGMLQRQMEIIQQAGHFTKHLLVRLPELSQKLRDIGIREGRTIEKV